MVPTTVPNVEKHPELLHYTRALLNWPVRLTICAVWLILAVAGIIVMKPMMASLVTDISSPPGTASYDATQVYSDSFAPPALDITVLVSSKDGSPIINMADNLNPMTPLTADAQAVSGALQSIVMGYAQQCANISFASYFSMVNASLPDSIPATLEREAQLALGIAGKDQFFNTGATSMIAITSISTCHSKAVNTLCVGKESYCDPVVDLQNSLLDYAETTLPASAGGSTLKAQVVSLPLMNAAAKDGIESTMDISTYTLPAALLVLACMLLNARLLLLPIFVIVGVLGCSILVVYPIALAISISSTATSLMIAVSLAMSIDYALFFLSRLMSELRAGRAMHGAVDISLRTSGRTVLVSGSCLTLCFLTMLVFPVSAVSTMGLAAAFTVVFAVAISLTLTPALLLSFPAFFGSSRLFGCSIDACCGAPAPTACCAKDTDCCQSTAAVMARSSCTWWPERGLWAAIGAKVQQCPWVALVLLAVLGAAVPFAIRLTSFGYSVGMLPTLPTGDSQTIALEDLQNAFGTGTIFPSKLVLIPPEGTDMAALSSQWRNSSCLALERIANEIHVEGYPFSVANFTGIMTFNGHCVDELLLTATAMGASPSQEQSVLDMLATRFDNAAGTASLISISLQADPFSDAGKQWITQLREAMSDASLVGSGVGTFYLTGMGPEQMDAANATFASFPLMTGLVVIVICLVFGVAFGSVVVPLRAALTVVWMLVLTFGAATYAYQGEIYWMSPCVAFAVVVGLGLDYDVFLMETVLEHVEGGMSANDAVLAALEQTGNLISAAGVIMIIAFAALLLGSTPVLYEIGFLLVIGVVIDCFVTTKFVIPCLMALMPSSANFWPRKLPEQDASAAQAKQPPSTGKQKLAPLSERLFDCGPVLRVFQRGEPNAEEPQPAHSPQDAV